MKQVVRSGLLLTVLCVATVVLGIRPQGAAAAGTAIRPGGFNPEPSMRPWRYVGPNPDGWFCVAPNCFGYATDGTQFVNNETALIAGTGAKYLRVEFPWYLIEPGNGVYNWSRADYIVNAAAAHGLILQPILVYTPAWAGCPNCSPTVGQWSSFVTTIVARYPGVRYWEMWNEPDLGQYWNAGAGQFVQQILKPGYQAVHQAHPGAQVLVGPSNPSWYSSLLGSGAKGSFDIAAYHNYSGGVAMGSAVSLQSLLASNGVSAPIWVGEYGLEENSIQDSAQQGLFTGMLTQPGPVAVAIWYNIRDDDSATCCPPVNVHTQTYGLVEFDGRTKKNGYGVMTSLLTGAPPPPPPPTPTPRPTGTPSASGTPVAGSPSASPGSSGSGSGKHSPAPKVGASAGKTGQQALVPQSNDPPASSIPVIGAIAGSRGSPLALVLAGFAALAVAVIAAAAWLGFVRLPWPRR